VCQSLLVSNRKNGDNRIERRDRGGWPRSTVSKGVFTTIDVPSAIVSQAWGINSKGDIVGSYSNATGRRVAGDDLKGLATPTKFHFAANIFIASPPLLARVPSTLKVSRWHITC